ncbi:MAG: hypothetical protein LBJ70_02825 [Holosporales bacterium]|nr:hypothetical protein [Holosporales bacterium]
MCFRRGRFPETLLEEEREESFVFVSLDVNLRLPTREALEFFYPRLHEGGVIFAHDCNFQYVLGVRKAV